VRLFCLPHRWASESAGEAVLPVFLLGVHLCDAGLDQDWSQRQTEVRYDAGPDQFDRSGHLADQLFVG